MVEMMNCMVAMVVTSLMVAMVMIRSISEQEIF